LKHDILCDTTGPVVDGGQPGGGLWNGASAYRIGRRWVRMTTFKPWEYRAEAGFVKGTELMGAEQRAFGR